MLLPEMYAIAMYPNSAIPAAACFIWALVSIIRNKHWAAILLMCIAPLFRLDVVIAYPAIFPLLIFVGRSWKKGFVISAIYCVIIVTIGLLLYHLCRADVFSAFGGYEKWNNEIGLVDVAKAIFGFYSITYFVLLPIGIILMIRKQIWKELFLVLLPIILSHFVYRSMGCAAKHYLYIAPFVIITGVRALTWIYNVAQRKILLKWIASLSVVSILIISFRVASVERAWMHNDEAYKRTLITSFFSTNVSTHNLSLGLGIGQFLETADEMMFTSGQLFYSWYIHLYKKEMITSREKFKKELDSLPTSYVVTTDWGKRAPALSKYFMEHNTIRCQDKRSFTVSNKERCLTIKLHMANMKDENSFWEDLKNYCASLNSDNIYVVANRPLDQLYLDSLTKKASVEKAVGMVYKINTSKIR